jgi:hypothetical protein
VLPSSLDRRPCPAVADRRIACAFALGAVLLLDCDEAPNLIALHAGSLHAAHMLIMIGKRDLASIPKQLIDGIDRAADDALDRTAFTPRTCSS